MRWKKILWKVAVVSLLVGVVFYNLRLAPVPATSHVVSRATVTEEVLGTGTLEARVRATVSSKISGRILQLLVDQGDRVQAGQLLMTLEDDELQQQVAIAEANVEAVQAAIERLETDKQRALAVAEQAQRSFERVEQLLRQKAVSQEEGDKALEALSVARAGLSLSEAAINEAHKEKISAIKSLEYQRARLSDTRITAPFEGMIVRREREPGDIVVPGTQVLSLISLNELWISAWVDETAMSRVQVGQPARVVFRAVPDQVFPGQVVRLGREADRETREFLVDVHVLELPKNWAVGQRAEVYVQAAQVDDALALPAEYVMRRDGHEGVQVLLSGRSQWRPIDIGLRGRQQVEVSDGLAVGTTVLRGVGAAGELPQGRAVAVSTP